MSIRPLSLLALACLALLLLPSVADGRSERPRELVLGRGRPWQTTGWVREGPRKGPTVLIVGGVHGNEPGGAYAAGQIRHWPLAAGRLVVVPRANVRALTAKTRYTPGVDRSLRNLNRNYPDQTAKKGPASRPRGEVASAIWSLVERYEPDWLLDLHEGFAPHRINPKSYGRCVIAHPDQPDALDVADRLVVAANGSVAEAARGFVRLTQVTRTTLARSAADHLGVRALTLETCYSKVPLSRRARRHRIMVRTLLTHLGMLADGVRLEDVLPSARPSGEIRVALYDAEGTGGPGVPRVFAQLGAKNRIAVVRVCPEDIRGGVLGAFDVVAFTGGSGSGQSRALRESGRHAVRRFVEEGGGYLGICAGAFLCTAGFSWSIPLLDAKTVSNRWRRGRGMVEIELTSAGRRRFDPKRGRVRVRYGNGPVIAPLGRDDLEDYEVLAWYRTEMAKNGSPAGVMKDSPAIASGRFGEGRVVWISPHPEQTAGLEEFIPRAIRWVRRR